jgi:hypothetical protein
MTIPIAHIDDLDVISALLNALRALCGLPYEFAVGRWAGTVGKYFPLLQLAPMYSPSLLRRAEAGNVANASANVICCPAFNASAKVAGVRAACTVANAASASGRMGPSKVW